MVRFISPEVGSLKLKNKELLRNSEAETVKKNKELQESNACKVPYKKTCNSGS